MQQPDDRTQTLTDLIDPARARALQAMLGDTPSIQSGDPLPPFAHHVYFWDPQTPADLGRDGHPATGGVIPDLGLPRRMWAAGRLTFHRPLIAGTKATKISTVESVVRKDGRSGPLGFVVLRHDIRQRGTLAVTEWQELVYRADTAAPAAPPIAPTDAAETYPITCDATLLFRYSALTFNGHRIHYDADYARNVEGYAAPVVHGPLLAHYLMTMANYHLRGLKTFQYRATSPLMMDEPATLCWQNGHAWVRAHDGRQCMTAQAT